MENQHKKILGYRDLSQEEIDLVNNIKQHGIALGALVEGLKAQESLDQRWISIGMTHLQQGFMALTRGVTKPDFF